MASTDSPLRYPGGKSSLAGFVKLVFVRNDLCDGEYAEPYCGGAGIALDLLQSQYVSRIHLNDIDPAIHAFWWSVFNDPDELCRRVSTVKLSVASWRRQRNIHRQPGQHDLAELGFAAFFLNRVNRSGILSAGPIGGLDQSGPWTMEARFNREALCRTIQSAAQLASRVKLYRMDAVRFMESVVPKMSQRSLVYLDPPYVVKGQRLYRNAYNEHDHAEIARSVTSLRSRHWLVSYDDVPLVRKLYEKHRAMTYQIGYSANRSTRGSEVMYFSHQLVVPPVSSPVSISRAELKTLVA